MTSVFSSRVLGTLGLAMLGAVFATAASACKDDRTAFDETPPPFDQDASVAPGACPFQCSLDGRSVIRACTGELVEKCADDRACGAARCQEPCAAAAADRSSNGCDFYFQVPRYDEDQVEQSCVATFVVNTSNQPVEVELEYEGKALDVSKSLFRTNPGDANLIAHTGPILPGDSAILFVADRDPMITHPGGEGRVGCPAGVTPALYAEVGGGTRLGSAIHLTTTLPVGLTMIYPFAGAGSFLPTATLLLPVPTWGKQNILVNGWEANVTRPGAQLLAAEDGTEITILPIRDIQNGNGVTGTLAKVPVTYRLNKGQYLQFVQSEELTGSIVESTKPIATFGGHAAANVPSQGNTADTFHQQIPPFAQWGSEYVGVGYRPRFGNEHEPMAYRIVAARDGTQLDYDPEIPPGAPTSLSAGEMVTFRRGTGDAFVVRTQDADHPIYVAAYMSSGYTAFDGAYFGGTGDPEFVNVVPTGQYLNAYSFYSDPTYRDASLVFVRKKTQGAFKDVWLECAGGNLTNFHPVGTRGEYEFTRIDLARRARPGEKPGDYECRNGLQRAKSDGPFTATVWGWDVAASYAYPGGMALRELVTTPLAPVQ